MEKKLYIFDLDDTLVRYGKKIKVPRQTFHLLRRLDCEGHEIIIVSYNPLCHFVAESTGLYKYARMVVYGKEDRYLLVQKALLQAGKSHITNFIYIDDRLDNIQDVKEHFPLIDTIRVTNPLTLYKYV